jgi:hypothetical protein
VGVTADVHALDEPVRDLYLAAEAVVGEWLRRCVIDTAVRQLGSCPEPLSDAAEVMARSAAPDTLRRLLVLLSTDVDEQRSNPLSVLRDAVAAPTAVLRDAGVPVVHRDEFAARHFPDDPYALGPAAWADVDPSLHEPGIAWGAWKAGTVLRRRRDEGRR